MRVQIKLRYTDYMKKIPFLLFILVITLLIGLGIFFIKNDITNKESVQYIPFSTPLSTQQRIMSSPEIATVEAIIDGDTIVLTDKRKVRYIGMDTPEIFPRQKKPECFGEEAALENKYLIEGKTITMKKDISETDKYGRLLRYVWVDGIFVNKYLVRQGYARSAKFPPDIAYANEFKIAAQEAKKEDKGLWNICK